MRKLVWLAAVTLAVTVPMSIGWAQSATQSLTAPMSVSPVVYTFTSPGGFGNPRFSGGTQVLISNHGNIVSFQSPGGYEHIGVGALSEGYVLCYTPTSGALVNAFDTGAAEAGFGAFFVNVPPPFFIDRFTADGLLKLHQAYTFEALQKSLRITHTITNVGPVSVTIHTFRRQVDFDIDTGGTNGWAGFANRHAADSFDGAWAWNDKKDAPAGKDAHAMALRHLAKPRSTLLHEGKVTAAILDSTCSPPHHDTLNEFGPPSPAIGYPRHDHGETIQYGCFPASATCGTTQMVGVLLPGRSVTPLTVKYTRF